MTCCIVVMGLATSPSKLRGDGSFGIAVWPKQLLLVADGAAAVSIRPGVSSLDATLGTEALLMSGNCFFCSVSFSILEQLQSLNLLEKRLKNEGWRR
jgi:hypothetical protein